MSKDAVVTMGEILPDDAGGRDAVHVAVVSCVASAKLMPGQDIGIGEQQGRDYEALATADHIGIVDPYLKGAVRKGERFWLYLYPRSITGLNHHWTHPAFSETEAASVYSSPSNKLASEQWLRNFISSSDCPADYDDVLELIKTGSYNDGEYNSGSIEENSIHFSGRDAHGEIPPEFWTHVSIVLGEEYKGPRPSYFSCSC